MRRVMDVERPLNHLGIAASSGQSTLARGRLGHHRAPIAGATYIREALARPASLRPPCMPGHGTARVSLPTSNRRHGAHAMNRQRPLQGALLTGTILLGAILGGCLPASRIASGPRSSATGNATAVRAVERTVADPALPYDRRAVLAEAERWIGTPYRFGGVGGSGIDCSALVQRAFSAANFRLPRNSAEQATVGETIPLAESSPGDLVFFNTLGNGVSHVGILIDVDQFVHASTSLGVTVSSLSETYYRDRMLFVRRVLR